MAKLTKRQTLLPPHLKLSTDKVFFPRLGYQKSGTQTASILENPSVRNVELEKRGIFGFNQILPDMIAMHRRFPSETICCSFVFLCFTVSVNDLFLPVLVMVIQTRNITSYTSKSLISVPPKIACSNF